MSCPLKCFGAHLFIAPDRWSTDEFSYKHKPPEGLLAGSVLASGYNYGGITGNTKVLYLESGILYEIKWKFVKFHVVTKDAIISLVNYDDTYHALISGVLDLKITKYKKSNMDNCFF